MATWSESEPDPTRYVCDGLGPDGDVEDEWMDRVLAAAFVVFLVAVAVAVVAQVVMRVRGRG